MNSTHIRRLRNLQHPANPHVKLTNSGRVHKGETDKWQLDSSDKEAPHTQDQMALQQLEDLEQEAARAEAFTGDDDLAWGLYGPSEDEGDHSSSTNQQVEGEQAAYRAGVASPDNEPFHHEEGGPQQPHQPDQPTDGEQAADQTEGANPDNELLWGLWGPGDKDEALSDASAQEDLHLTGVGPEDIETEGLDDNQATLDLEDIGTLEELRELHRNGIEVIWPPGWYMNGAYLYMDRDLTGEQNQACSPLAAIETRPTGQDTDIAPPEGLAELLELYRDGVNVVWPPGWNPHAAELAYKRLSGNGAGPCSWPGPSG